MNIVAIIPARYGSTRLPAKPLVDLCGKPMIQHVAERTQRAKLIHRVIVATDDARIVSAVREFGGEVMITPSDIRTGSDRVAFVARHLPDADIVVNVQGDEPLIVPQSIDAAVKPLLNNDAIYAATLVKKITMPEELINPNVVKAVLDNEGFAVYFSRSPVPYLRDGEEMGKWHTRHTYYKHLGLYAFRREFLLKFSSWGESALECAEKLEQLRIIENGFRIKATVTEFDSIPVDTAPDAERVRRLLEEKGVEAAS
ncbi:MAG TPA: 3-deoxy-manno-octulosonate cytidylyltransferase [Bacteroidota bacterium]|nr:3-deoxy-manno-octulosonate cytidylyltransferase [Bacteroidota bacterium]